MGVGDLIAYISAGPDQDQDIKAYVEAVHRLTERGAVVTYAAHETSQEGFDAEWRGIAIFTVEGDMVNRTEVFDEADLDAAIARFDQLSQPAPRLENAASQVTERFAVHLRARDWDAMAELLADDFCSDDRRGVVGAGIQHGRDAHMADMRTIVDLWITNVSSTIIATRGERLVLMRTHFSGSDQGPGAFLTEVFGLVEIDTDERIVAIVSFDLEDFDAAIAELDARYLASEGAAHAHVWSVIASGFGSIRRYELPPTTPDCVSIDHRRTAAFAPGELNAYFRAAFDLTADVKIYVEAVHRLNDVGTVCTHVTHGVSHEGFAAEWREVDVLMVEGDIVNHCEIFDEADIDAALAKFEELSPHEGRLKNAASRASDRYLERVARPRLGRNRGNAGRRLLHRRSPSCSRWRHPRSRCRDRQRASASQPRRHARHADRHCGPRRAPRPQPCPLLGSQSRARRIRCRDADRLRNRTQTAGSQRPSRSTSTMSTPPSRNSMLGTLPAKRPPTRRRGRSSHGVMPQPTETRDCR